MFMSSEGSSSGFASIFTPYLSRSDTSQISPGEYTVTLFLVGGACLDDSALDQDLFNASRLHFVDELRILHRRLCRLTRG